MTPARGKRLVRAFTTCAVVLATVLVGQGQAPSGDPQQLQVEQAADRLMKRFYETLHFETIWKEEVVSSQSLRATEVAAILKQILWDAKQRIPYADQERAFIAERNFQMLMSAIRFTGRDEVDRTTLERELKEPYESITQMKHPVLSAADLDARFTAVMNRMNDVLRKYVKPDLYNGKAYVAQMNRFPEDNPDETKKLREIFADDLKPDQQICLARREMFYLYFVKEGDALRFLTLSGRLRD